MRLRYLQALRAVMEAGSVTEAARRMGRTQPQVSRLIGALEEELGFPLFLRQSRRMLPTMEGIQFYEATRHILLGFDDVTRVAKDIRTGKDAWLKVVAQPYLAHGVFPQAIPRFSKSNPNLRVSLEIRSRADVGLWVSGQQFDLGFAALPLEAPGVRAEPFAKVRAVVAMPKKHRLARKERIRAEDLVGEPFIALKPFALLRHHIDELISKKGLQLTIQAETSSGASACQLVAQGLGVTLSDPMAAQAIPGLVTRPWEPELRLTYGFLYPTAYAPTASAKEFSRVLKQCVKDCAPDEVELVA